MLLVGDWGGGCASGPSFCNCSFRRGGFALCCQCGAGELGGRGSGGGAAQGSGAEARIYRRRSPGNQRCDFRECHGAARGLGDKSGEVVGLRVLMCAIFGVYNHQEAATLAYLGLSAQQHRGQESAGIVSSDKDRFYAEKGMGHVAEIFTKKKLAKLAGRSAVGHTRYATAG